MNLQFLQIRRQVKSVVALALILLFVVPWPSQASRSLDPDEGPDRMVVVWVTRTQLKLLSSGPYPLAKDAEIINDLPGAARNYPLRLALPAYAEIEWDEHYVKRVRLVEPYKGSIAE